MYMDPNGKSLHQLLKNNTSRYTTPFIPVSNQQPISLLSKKKRSGTQIPSSEEIKRFSETFLASKKLSPETSPTRTRIKSERMIKLPRITLKKALNGVNTGTNWFNPDEDINLSDKANKTRYGSKPSENSKTKLFPSRDILLQEFPKSLTERFGQIDVNADPELANYLVNSKNAFKSHWSKHKTLKDRKFYPDTHPEHDQHRPDFNKKSDDTVMFREAMLLCKNMMKEAWSVKK